MRNLSKLSNYSLSGRLGNDAKKCNACPVGYGHKSCKRCGVNLEILQIRKEIDERSEGRR